MRAERPQTFPLQALLPQDADQSQEPGDLLQVENRGVVQPDDGQRLVIVGAAATTATAATAATAVLRQPGGTNRTIRTNSTLYRTMNTVS